MIAAAVSTARRRNGEQERRSHAWWLEPSARSRSQVQPRLRVVEEAEGPGRSEAPPAVVVAAVAAAKGRWRRRLPQRASRGESERRTMTLL